MQWRAKRARRVEKTPQEVNLRLSGTSQLAGIPDMVFIRAIPIREVAIALGLTFGSNGHIHCWYPERHQHGDRTASVGLDKRRNKLKCFGCNSALLGPIDLVKDVLAFESAKDAALWIAARFNVPSLPKGKHLRESARIIHQVGQESPIELLVRSGLWSELSGPTVRLAPTLISLADRITGSSTYVLKISYLGIMRYSGIKSPNALRSALLELENLGWLAIRRAAHSAIVRHANEYLLTPYSDKVLEAAQAKAVQIRDEIIIERELRAQNRRMRQHLTAPRNDPHKNI